MNFSITPSPKFGDRRKKRRFAWLPTVMKQRRDSFHGSDRWEYLGQVLWLESYWSLERSMSGFFFGHHYWEQTARVQVGAELSSVWDDVPETP